MKHLLILTFFLVGCGSGGSTGGSETGVVGSTPGTPAPTCKGINSVWTSKTDLESFDLTALVGGVTIQEYQYTAYDGATCGYVYNPNHNLTAQLIIVGAGYTLNMRYSLAMTGQCATYLIPGSIGDKDQAAFITSTGCNEIQICTQTTCKLFH